MVVSHHVDTRATPLTCNCLLPDTRRTSPASEVPVYAACYELNKKSDESQTEAQYSGIVGHTVLGREGDAAIDSSWRTSEAMPGVFDLSYITAASVDPLITSRDAKRHEHYLLATSTDGCVRIMCPESLEVIKTFEDIHTEMITSCTPHLTSSNKALQLLCSAHGGDVVRLDTSSGAVDKLEGHEFDAWCTAVAPGLSHDSAEDDAVSGDSGALLFSGGDDALLKIYDPRQGASAVSKMRFGAGVVSITPVLHTSNSNGSGCISPTPYCLVGSYDESIALIDVRSMRRPISAKESLGGGVWRTSRAVFPVCTGNSGPSTLPSTLGLMAAHGTVDTNGARRGCGWVNQANVLALPLMQRGVALMGYNVYASPDSVFGEPYYFYTEEDDGEGEERDAADTRGVVSENCLVYDTAVVALADNNSNNSDSNEVAVSACSFYERKIDVWRVSGAEALIPPSA